jgi:hypothetical protein
MYSKSTIKPSCLGSSFNTPTAQKSKTYFWRPTNISFHLALLTWFNFEKTGTFYYVVSTGFPIQDRREKLEQSDALCINTLEKQDIFLAGATNTSFHLALLTWFNFENLVHFIMQYRYPNTRQTGEAGTKRCIMH